MEFPGMACRMRRLLGGEYEAYSRRWAQNPLALGSSAPGGAETRGRGRACLSPFGRTEARRRRADGL